MPTSTPAEVIGRWPRVAVTAVFLANGLLFASWTAHIPDVKASLGLSNGTLGFALLGAPLGSVAAMVVAGYLLPKLGSRRVVQMALAGYCAAGPIVGLTGNVPGLFAALFVWGAFQGTLDVAMNTQGIAVERASGQALMSGLHGSWSIGSFAGAGIGALAVGVGVTLTPQLLVLGAVLLFSTAFLTMRMLSDTAQPRSVDGGALSAVSRRSVSSRSASRWSGGMLNLAAIAFACMLCEGAAADWAAVYVSGSLHTSGVVPGLGYAAFSLAMVTVRLLGNQLLGHYRLDRLLPTLAAIATIGFATCLVLDRPVAAIVGFACLGLGLASIVPAVFSAAGRIAGLHPGTAVATVSACGWAGFVFGPPIIGHLASLTSLSLALGLLPVLTAFVAVASAFARGLKTPVQ